MAITNISALAAVFLLAVISSTHLSVNARPVHSGAARTILQEDGEGAAVAVQPTIVGGSAVKYSRYPYAAVLFSKEKAFCSGSLIAPNIVLTAGHCVQSGDVFGVKIGVRDWLLDDILARSYQARQVITSITHPDYARNTIRNIKYVDLIADLALLVLTDPLPADWPVLALPTAATTVPDKTKLQVIGYGATSEYYDVTDNKILREVSVNAMERTKCNKLLNNINPGAYNLTTANICAGVMAGGKDACRGDSGGPLFIKGKTYADDVLVGLTSFGEGCARKNTPAGYTNILQYAPWIVKKVQQLSSK